MQIRTIPAVTCCFAMLAAGAVAYAASLSSADRQFMVMAAKTDMMEAHEGQMAENQANQSNVKDFAKTLVRDPPNPTNTSPNWPPKPESPFLRESTLPKTGA